MIKNDRSEKQTDRAVMFILGPDGVGIDWQESLGPLDERQGRWQQSCYDAFMADAKQALYDLAFAGPDLLQTPSCRYLGALGRRFVQQLAQMPEREFLRENLALGLSPDQAEELTGQAPFMIGLEHLSAAWLKRHWASLRTVYVREISGYAGTVADYLAVRHAAVLPAGRVFFHLVENKRGEAPFAFLATYAVVDDLGHVRHVPLKNALVRYKDQPAKMLELLATVNKAAEQSDFVREIVASGELFHPLGLEADEAYRFLKEIPLYEGCGILCRIPAWWRQQTGRARVSVTLGSQEPARFGFDTLVDFKVRLVLGDLELNEADVAQLLAETDGLALIKGRWVEVDHARLNEVLQAYEKARKLSGPDGIDLVEAFRLQVRGTGLNLADADELVEVSQGTWFSHFFGRTGGARALPPCQPGPQFTANLRPYQSAGLDWLWQMKQLRLGACLADDMGLGKTVQIIALLDAVRQQKAEKTLLVLPASLIGNWKQELDRFAPALCYRVLHPSEQSEPVRAAADLDGCDLLLTTYGMISRTDWLKDMHWDNLVLDEAQAIKNPGTRQTRAVKKLNADWRAVLTGTPIENRLADLWSIFDFLNAGLLGTSREFGTFTQTLQTQNAGYGRLRQMLSPLILRRLKTDRAVIDDLPEKIEMKTYAGLSKKQAVLYQQKVSALREALDQPVSQMERRGLILSSIVTFKQICNHPDQYTGQTGYDEKESGKFARLREICETIYEKRERVLVFTQFRELTEPLAAYLEQIFGHRGLVLHGGTPVARRRQLVADFQGQAYIPYMVLSVKAGGVGLNLTAANHVIHFDRWWNPAVENQATDRAFRIGQKKNVLVHKLITTGTIEEKIDQMIEDKTGLARDIIPEKQETWITEMSNQQLMQLFSLTD
ncbi:MAG: DEAD/DEAH box helicase [Clostridiaceae bacterium]|nr:DEAD/DEAH box helicase [Clostridiaceae bacterium]